MDELEDIDMFNVEFAEEFDMMTEMDPEEMNSGRNDDPAVPSPNAAKKRRKLTFSTPQQSKNDISESDVSERQSSHLQKNKATEKATSKVAAKKQEIKDMTAELQSKRYLWAGERFFIKSKMSIEEDVARARQRKEEKSLLSESVADLMAQLDADKAKALAAQL
eukprot:g3348.t1